MNELEWSNMLDKLERDAIAPPEMVWRSADGTDWAAPSSKEKREPILLWPDGREKRVMELRRHELHILADAHSRSGDRMTGRHAAPQNPSKGQG
jgi:hypothetical protein